MLPSPRPVPARARQGGRPAQARCQGPAVAVRCSAGAQESRKVCIMVEPSPFSHVSGMKNRFVSLIRGLREAGDKVLVVTPDPQPPRECHGAQVVNVLGFKLPFYQPNDTLLLSTAISLRVLWHLLTLRPDVIHVSSPGLMVFAATLYAKLLAIPLVVSYHTHIPQYIPKYTWTGLVQPMWSIIRWCTQQADLTLVTSSAMKQELGKNQCRTKSIDVWQRGVDTEVFSPAFRSADMRARMSGGQPDAPLLLYVGRLGAEKNLGAIRQVMEAVPGCRLALVGDGPARAELEAHFRGLPVTFMGLMRGRELSAAYASADIFVMPSETETLGFVVLEAMASGLPVVAVRAGGIPDVITQPGTTGLLYEPNDYAEAARLVASLVQQPAAARSMGAVARQEVEKWGWGAATKKIREQQYKQAIRVNSGKRRFVLLALRVRFACLFKWLLRGLLAAITWVVDRLDYARAYRSSPGGVSGGVAL